MPGRAVMSEQGVQEGAEHAPLRGPCDEDQGGGCVVLLPAHTTRITSGSGMTLSTIVLLNVILGLSILFRIQT